MASSLTSLVSNDYSSRIKDQKYFYALNANVSNFVSVKLSGKENYHLWKTQMRCLMKAHCMCGLVHDAGVNDPSASSGRPMLEHDKEYEEQYDNLLKGWIFGSISEGVLGTVTKFGSAKEVWNKLEQIYAPSTSNRQAQVKPEEKEKAKDDGDSIGTETKGNDAGSHPAEKDTAGVEEAKDNDASKETKTKGNEPLMKTEGNDGSETKKKTKGNDAGSPSAEKDTEPLMKTKDNDGSEEKKTKGNDAGSPSTENDDARKKELCKATMQGSWKEVEDILTQGKDLERAPLDREENRVLHLAVGIGDHGFIKELVQFIVKKDGVEKTSNSRESALTIKNSNGSTALHVAAIVGNKDAAKLLVEKNKDLLTIKDEKDEPPLLKAYSNMQFDTFMYLWDEDANDKTNGAFSKGHDYIKKGVDLLVNAISAKNYGKASEIVKKFPDFARKNDEALLAIARTFPNGLDYWETVIYPCSLSDTRNKIIEKLGRLFVLLVCCEPEYLRCEDNEASLLCGILFWVPVITVVWVYFLLSFLIYMVYLPFYLVYFLWWKAATRLGVPPVNEIMKKKKEWDEAKELLELVCSKIEEDAETLESIYEKPILEAARQNAYEVFDEILHRSPEAIHTTDENGYDFIHLAVIHRSEKIYNLIYKIGERKSHYGTSKDSSENNILHLVGRLAPSLELNSRTGAALQLQRELQWREELKKLVFPAYITQENIFKETPAMVFTREHRDLVKEGEKWMKTTAESCSITAGLITTIVFAAAITVPGGNHEKTGIPVFIDDIAFIIFAASDAISLFASSTALLVFLSILTARFAEQDFLISLPRRLIIGFCALLLSTTSMMVSFSAILYIVFCDKKSWMIGLICGLAFIPIACFVALQFSLIVDLYRSTYVRIFGQKTNWRRSRFNPRYIQGHYK